MEKFLDWWKREKRYAVFIKSLLLALLPIAGCLVYCGIQGKTLGQVYLPSSEWNDELFYFKQVESIVRYGYPRGYFGFNESHALKLSFAAWSPVLVAPWIVWGLLFGWNLMSPILCNIVLLTLACFLFGWLARPSWKQIGVLVFLFFLFTPFVRYMLSGMPEIICFSALILFYSLAVNYLDREKNWKLALLFVLAGFMTLMRPYLLLFLLLPVYFWVRKSRIYGAVGSALVVCLVLALYAGINHYLSAPYFDPLFFTDWAEAFLTKGLFGGIHDTLGKLYYMGISFCRYTLEGIRTGLAAGAFFGGYLVMAGIFVFQGIRDFLAYRKSHSKDVQKRLILEAHMAFCMIAMLFALLLMYKLTEGSKHFLTFLAAGIFLVALMETRFYKKAVLLGVAFAYFYSYKAVDPYDYQVPFVTQERESQVQGWQTAFSENLRLAETPAPSYENVVLWVFSDETDKGSENTAWQLLYGLPEGFGISCCTIGYVWEHFDTLHCRYLVAPADGQVDRLCAQTGYQELHRDQDMALYLIGAAQ